MSNPIIFKWIEEDFTEAVLHDEYYMNYLTSLFHEVMQQSEGDYESSLKSVLIAATRDIAGIPDDVEEN